ncbi:MAG: InlB B-repeat-containing protein [Clostridia bacterium]|nr:InlB B-repeat-containing protein [Clostridia bacterium]
MTRSGRILSLVIAMIMVIGMIPMTGVAATETAGFDNFAVQNTVESDTFTDIAEDDWFYDDVKAVYELGLMVGKGEGTFAPESSVTIAEAITIAARLNSIYTNGTDEFEASEVWYQTYVDYATENGILTFEVADYTAPAKRAEFALIMANALPEEALEAVNAVADGAIPDVAADAAYAEAVYALYRAGIMVGNDEAGTFAPDTEINRSEVAAITARMADTELRKEVTLGEEETTEAEETTVEPEETTVEPEETTVPEDTTVEPEETTTVPKDTTAEPEETTVPEEDDEERERRLRELLLAFVGIQIGNRNNNTYTITFNSNGGTDVASQTVIAGGLATEPEAPSKDDVAFEGWYTDTALTNRFDFTTPITSDIILYANWVSGFTVSFDLNYDGAPAAPANQVVAPGEKATEPLVPFRNDFTFICWATDAAGDNPFNFNTNITQSITLYAKWAKQNGTNPVSLDDVDPDVEIYSFNTDVYDILLGDTRTVTFTSEIFANIELDSTAVAVISEDGTVLGYMNDDGINGDVTEDDGIYTLKTSFTATAVGNTKYSVTVNNIVTSANRINIGYYREYTDADFNSLQDVVDAINAAIAAFVDADGYLLDDKYEDANAAAIAVLDEFVALGVVSEYTPEEYIIHVQLTDGLPFIYTFEVRGIDAGGSVMNIATYEPYKGEWDEEWLNTLSTKSADGSATLIDNEFDNYVFANNYDLAEVSIEALKNISENTVIIWRGHGGYSSVYGSFIGIGQSSAGDRSAYSDDINNGNIIPLSSGKFGISGGFIDKYVSSMNGGLVWLGACSTGKDMLDGIDNNSSLVQAFINKGATAVIGSSGSVDSSYSSNFAYSFFKNLTKTNGDGNYNNVARAYALAAAAQGATDATGTRFVIFPLNSSTALDYTLYKEETGYISGSIKDAETGAAIAGALVRIYKDGVLVASVRSNSVGYYDVEVPADEYIVKITAGSYKSAKMSVTVTANNTTYNETMMLVNVGVTSGYANGIISSALTGEGVDGVTIKVRSGWNNYYGQVLYTTETNENGYYEISYTPGVYTLEYSKSGYITGYKNIVIGVIDLVAQNAVISPSLADGAWRITLLWVDHPSDLDSHLTGPIAGSSERFHLYYPMKESGGGHANSDKYTLDLDNTTIRTRPDVCETTTILQQIEGVYRFSVHDYSNGSSTTSTEMASSNAVVKVYKGNSNIPVATFHVPTNAVGTIWNVFEINGDTITPINRITSGNSGSVELYGFGEAVCDDDADVILDSIVAKP